MDGGAEQEALCEANISERSPCPGFLTAFETEGEFVITASFEMEDPNDPACVFADSTSMTVTGDEGHVEGQEVTLELDTTLQLCSATTG